VVKLLDNAITSKSFWNSLAQGYRRRIALNSDNWGDTSRNGLNICFAATT